jgi:hypothetical protein
VVKSTEASVGVETGVDTGVVVDTDAGTGEGVGAVVGTTVGTDVGTGEDVGAVVGTAVGTGEGVGAVVGTAVEIGVDTGNVVGNAFSAPEQATANAETIATTHTVNPVFNVSSLRPSDTCSASPHSLLPEPYDYPAALTPQTISSLSSVSGPPLKSPNT